MIKKVGVVVLLIFLVLAIRLAGNLDNSYVVNATVNSYSNNEVVFTDWQHDLWVYDTDEKFTVGDKIKVKFHTNYTEHNRRDDTILWIKRAE